jgi:hypothetical protein
LADVDASEADTLLQQQKADAQHPPARNCPGCDRPSCDLSWIYFSSPAWTWEKLCGRAGWLVVCKDCHLQVDFFLSVMN